MILFCMEYEVIILRKVTDYEGMVMLCLSDAERLRLQECFDGVVSGFSVLDDVNTDGVSPLVSVLDLHNVLREDVSCNSISRDELLKNAPEQHDGYFQVPAAID